MTYVRCLCFWLLNVSDVETKCDAARILGVGVMVQLVALTRRLLYCNVGTDPLSARQEQMEQARSKKKKPGCMVSA